MKRILAGLLAALLGVGLGMSAALPASANGAGHGCNDVGITNTRICLYNWIDFNTSGGFWQRDLATVHQNCVNLANHSWHNGGSVNDATSSFIVTVGTVPTNTTFHVRFYNWTNCSSASGYIDHYADRSGEYLAWDTMVSGWNDHIGSVQIFLELTPPPV